MKFTCLRENLVKGLNIVSKAVPIKGPLPILTNILISVKDGRIKFSATNLETAISTYIGGSVEEEGIVTVPGKVFRDFVSNLADEKVLIELDNDIIKVSGGKSKGKINGLAADDYPPLPAFVEDTVVLQLDPLVFSTAVSLVAFSASIDETRPLYSGILFNYSSINKTLTLVSTNGYRLSEKIIPLEGDFESFTKVLPAKTVQEVARIFAGSSSPISLTISSNDNMVLFQAENTLVATRVIDGEYPDYRRIVPTTKVVTVELAADHLMEAAKLAGIFAKDVTDSVLIKIDPTNNVLSLKSVSQEMGDHQSEIEADIEGEALEMAFQPKYLLDMLSNVKATRLVIESAGSTAPCVVRPTDDEHFFHLMMPLRLNN